MQCLNPTWKHTIRPLKRLAAAVEYNSGAANERHEGFVCRSCHSVSHTERCMINSPNARLLVQVPRVTIRFKRTHIMFVFAFIALAIHVWNRTPSDAFPVAQQNALDLGQMHFKDFLFQHPLRTEDAVAQREDDSLVNAPLEALLGGIAPDSTHLIAPVRALLMTVCPKSAYLWHTPILSLS